MISRWSTMTFLRIVILPTSFVEHDLFRKPVSTFRDHALIDADFGAGNGRKRMRRSLACVIAALATAVACTSAGAQYPTRAVRVIVPFPGGGINDILARII